MCEEMVFTPCVKKYKCNVILLCPCQCSMVTVELVLMDLYKQQKGEGNLLENTQYSVTRSHTTDFVQPLLDCIIM